MNTNTVQSIIKKHITIIDNQLSFKDFSGKSLAQWFEPLLSSITDDGAIAYLIGSKKRYRASPLASTLEWLENSNLLPREAIELFEDKLIFLRDSGIADDADAGCNRKFNEDINGWSLSEGVSIWSTSTAIISLLDNYNVWEKHIQKIKESVLWLSSQQNIENYGWAYQSYTNCKVNSIMTSLALRAIAKTLQNKNKFKFSSEEEKNLRTAITGGVQYLKDNIVINNKKNISYWTFQDKEHCTATTWALLALCEIDKLGLNDDIKNFYHLHLQRGLQFILSKMPKKPSRWIDEKMVEEGGAKYNKQKNYYSFCVTLLPQLFQLGLSPFHPKVIMQIQWLINNPTEWKIKEYDQSQVCSFTYAMVIATIAKWATYVGKINSTLLIQQQNIYDKISYKLYGIGNDYNSPIRLILKKRLYFFVLIIFLLLVLLFAGPYINDIVVSFATYILTLVGESGDQIVIDVISSVIYAILTGIICAIWKIIKCIRRARID